MVEMYMPRHTTHHHLQYIYLRGSVRGGNYYRLHDARARNVRYHITLGSIQLKKFESHRSRSYRHV